MSKRLFLSSAILISVATIGSAILASNQAVAEDVYPDGMISYWKFDESEGAVAADSVGANDGVISGAVRVPGIVGEALQFTTEADDNVVPVNEASFDFEWDDPLTVEAWIKPDLNNDFVVKSIFNKQASYAPYRGYGFFLYNRPNPHLHFEMVATWPDTYGAMNVYEADVNFNDPGYVGQWTHVAATYNGSGHWTGITLFINGAAVEGELVLDKVSIAGRDITNDEPAEIGSRPGYGYAFDGSLDEVAVYDRVLTSDEIEAHYLAGLDGNGYELKRMVTIDIKPGSDPNAINSDGHGVIPVAILGEESFDVITIDPGTVELEGMGLKVVGKSNRLLASIEDVNGDGHDDLVVKIEDQDGVFLPGETVATLTGTLYDGMQIEGSDTVVVID